MDEIEIQKALVDIDDKMRKRGVTGKTKLACGVTIYSSNEVSWLVIARNIDGHFSIEIFQSVAHSDKVDDISKVI